jgi:hypothetical protein
VTGHGPGASTDASTRRRLRKPADLEPDISVWGTTTRLRRQSFETRKNPCSNYIVGHSDIAFYRLRVRADALRILDEGLRDTPFNAGNGDVEAGTEEVLSVFEMKINLGIDR